MMQRKTKTARVKNPKPTADRLKGALAKRPKAELIDLIVEFASADRGVLRQLESRFGVDAPPAELIAATRVAIADATDFDEREINYNFDYDYAAYEAVKRNLSRLISLNHGKGCSPWTTISNRSANSESRWVRLPRAASQKNLTPPIHSSASLRLLMQVNRNFLFWAMSLKMSHDV